MSADVIVEKVPGFVKRIGDRVIEGSNNAIMWMGTDRVGAISSGLGHVKAQGGGKGTGTISLIVGRSAADPDFGSDSSFLYMSMKTDVDVNVRTDIVEEKSPIGPAAILKSDSLRFIARRDVKIFLGGAYIFMKSDGTIVIDGPTIKLGTNAVERIVKGDSFMRFFNEHVHPTAVGPSGQPIVKMTAAFLSSRTAFVD